MANAALFDNTSANSSYVEYDLGSPPTKLYVAFQIMRTSAQTAAMTANSTAVTVSIADGSISGSEDFGIDLAGGVQASFDYDTGAGAFTSDVWHQLEMLWEPGVTPTAVAFDGVTGVDNLPAVIGNHVADLLLGSFVGVTGAGEGIYIGKVWIGTDAGLHDILLEDWSGGTFANWTSAHGTRSVVAAPSDPPTLTPALTGPVTAGRVLIALNDGPLVAAPTWTRIDDTNNLVSGYDFESGKQTLTSRTDTGTATVHINDTAGLFDPNNSGSPYYGKIGGRQILLQVYDPVGLAWEPQWRGVIDEAAFDIDPATKPGGALVVANVQLNCVDVFDYLAGYGLTPGLDGVVPPPAGSEGTIWYAETAGTVDDRIIEVLTDANVDSAMQVIFSGNVKLQVTNYDADESALTVLRDCADAELPFIANIYVDRQGRFCFHGRRSRFDPDGVSASATPGAWPFTRWKVGDGAAITGDATRAQMRVLAYTDGRPNIINAVLCYPKGIKEVDIPGQVYADASSITAYGKHAASPITDLVIKEGTTTGYTGNVECQKYAELLVKNQKDPRPTITSLVLKSVPPADARAAATWPVLTQADISDIVNIKVGYPGGVGIGNPSGEDYYIEGRRGSVRPLNTGYDYVELQLDVSPAVWSMDTHSVFSTITGVRSAPTSAGKAGTVLVTP